MKFRLLIILPVVLSAAFLIFDLAVFGENTNQSYRRIQIEFVKILWIFGSLAAALKFRKGDYLRTTWLLMAVHMIVIVFRDVISIFFLPRFSIFSNIFPWVNGGLITLANLLQVLGVWMLSRAWKVADIKLPGPIWSQWLIGLIAAGLSIAVAGPVVWENFGLLVEGQAQALVGFASALGDMITLCMVAPLFLTALALKGGYLVWPWSFFTASSIVWLFYDATGIFFVSLSGSAERFDFLINEFFRSLACLLGFSAGMAQRFVVEKIEKDLR